MRDALRDRFTALVAAPRVGLIAMGVAFFLSLPSVPTGWYLDDLIHRARFLEIGPMVDGSDMTERMFDFLSGEPDQIQDYKDLGVLPWWAYDELRIRFYRPLSSATHVLDYRLWPDSGLAMHLHNVLWLVLLVGSVALLYRRFIAAPFVAGLATLLYALDDAHAMPVAFLANRNAMIATTFGVLSLWLHDRFRREGWRLGAVASPLALLAALLGGESGIGIAPYLLGYALFVEHRAMSFLARLTTVAPHALVGLGWLLFYRAGGYGTSGSGFYLDPLGEPAAWLTQFIVRAPLLLLGQWFVPPSSFAFAWTPAQMQAVAAFGVLVLGTLFVYLRPILRESATARFFAFGMLLAVIPITAGYPHDRLLFFVGIGGMALLAMLLVRLFDRSRSPGFRGARALGWALVVVHFVIAPVLHLAMGTTFASQESIYAEPARSLPDEPALTKQRLLVVNQPLPFYGQFTLVLRALDGTPVPRSQLMLAPGMSPLTLERISANRIEIEASAGWLGAPFDNVYRSETRPFPSGYEVCLTDVCIEVLTFTEDGRPERVAFTFTHELEHGSLRWVRYDAGRFVPFDLPAAGETVTLDPVELSLFSPPARQPGGDSATLR